MSDQPVIRVNYGAPPIGIEVFVPGSEPEVSAVASREAAEREGAYLRSMNPPRTKVPLPALKKPVLPGDFQARLDKLDRQIHEQGVAMSAQRILQEGNERFTDLLAKDHSARAIQRVVGSNTDLTDWPSVEFAFAKAGSLTTPVKRRTIAEQVSGAGTEREEAAKISGFSDLWKAQPEPQSVRDVYAFHDAFASLVFGQSLLERLHDDGRAQSYTFAGGSGKKAELFTDWLDALQGPHFTMKLNDPLWHVLSWLAGEKTPAPTELAQDFLGVRAPTKEQLAFCDAVWHGFLLGYSGWSLWNYVGHATRQMTAVETLETWRQDLAHRYPSITVFHDNLKGAFLRPVSSAAHGHFQFDEAGYRKFIASSVQSSLNHLSGLLAILLEETLPGTISARFQSPCWLLCEINDERAKNYPKNFLGDTIGEKLEVTFCGHTFYHTAFTIEELS